MASMHFDSNFGSDEAKQRYYEEPIKRKKLNYLSEKFNHKNTSERNYSEDEIFAVASQTRGCLVFASSNMQPQT